MEIVEHENHWLREPAGPVEESCKPGFAGCVRFVRTERRGERGNALQRRREVGQESDRVVVTLIQREPGHRAPDGVDPLRKQSRLSIARRGRDERQLPPRDPGSARQRLVQTLQQTGPRNSIGTRRGHVEFGFEKTL
jgi:hypothetical protein